MEAFLQSLPRGWDDTFRVYLERWRSGRFTIYWGKVGFSLRANAPNGTLTTILDAYPTYISLFVEKWLPGWGDPVDAYRAYRAAVDTIPEVRRINSQSKRYASYDRLSPDEMRILLDASDKLATALVERSHTHSPR
jgi:hypothetical protein